MEGRGLQELVKRVFSDEKTKEEFTADPNLIISRFSLSESEKRAVLATHMKLGLVTAGSSRLETITRPTTLWSSPTP